MPETIGGHFYWKKGLRGPVAERIPTGSGTPAPAPYLMKQSLTENEMNLSILVLEKRYPCEGAG